MLTTVSMGLMLTCAAASRLDLPQNAVTAEVEMYLTEQDFFRSLEPTVSKWKRLPTRDQLKLVVLLAKRLDSNQKIGLVNIGRLTIPYRETTGDIKPYEPGGTINQDLYIVGGKVAWAIEELVGIQLPEINEGLGREERAKRVEIIARYVNLFEQVVTYLLESDYPAMLRTVEGWQALPVENRLRVAELLTAHLTSTVKPGLKNHLNNVKVHYRVETGEMPRGNFKRHTFQDLYIHGGKAAWAINDLIDPHPGELPEITEGQTEEERARQARAIKLCVAAYKSGIKHASAPTAPPKK